MRTWITLLALLPLAACGGWPSGSYVQTVSDQDAAVLAPVIANYLAGALPAGSTVAVAPAQSGDPIGPLLAMDLEREGFGQAKDGRVIRYVAAPLESGILLRVSIDDREGASGYFIRSSAGTIQRNGPMMVARP